MTTGDINPILQCYDTLWALLEANTAFTTLVEPGNRIKFDTDKRRPDKDVKTTADYPQCRIVPISTQPHLEYTSSGSKIIKTFQIEILTGDRRVDAGLFDLEWAIYGALLGWDTTMKTLEWNGKKFVKLCRPMMVRDSITPGQSVAGWTSVWACEIDMVFTTSDMRSI